MWSFRSLSTPVAIPVVMLASFGLVHAAAQPSNAELSSLPEAPPLQQTIVYVGKTTTTDFSGPGMGQHLRYFPAFGLETASSELRTDCDGCIEFTPDFENFKHHLPADLIGRTFSPDAAGFGAEGDDDYVPTGVKTAGGNPNWDVFILPDGTVGRSGTTTDTHACGNANSTVNQIRINTAHLRDFCLNLITDNTALTHDPRVRIEARSDEVDLSLENHPDLTFDGATDMYTFRYMGMQEGDRIKIRIKSDGDDSSCAGAGLGGIMVSHIATCTPPPGSCVPNCEARACGDDGCGGSCGVCPRANVLTRISGEVNVSVVEGGQTLAYTQSSVEAPVEVSASLAAVLDEIETELSDAFHAELVETANDAPVALDVRNYRLELTPRTIGIGLTAMGPPNEDRFEMVFTLGGFFQHAKFKPESSLYTAGSLDPNARVDVTATNLAATGTYDPLTGDIRGPYDPSTGTFEPDPVASVGDVVVSVSTSDDWDNLVDVAQLFDLDAPSKDLLAQEFESALRVALLDRLGPAAGDELSGLLRPAVELVPEQVEIGGVDHAPPIRAALLEPTPGQQTSILFDASPAELISGSDPIEEEILARLSVDVGETFSMASTVHQTTFPQIIGYMDQTSIDPAGHLTVSGWTCAEGLERSLDVGLFADGVAIGLDQADLVSEPAVGAACGTDGSLDRYRYALTLSPEELGCINAWDHRISLIAGDDGFEWDLGEVHRTHAGIWMEDATPGGTSTFPSATSRQFVGDFDGDHRADYLWERQGWWVARSNGNGFDVSSAPWLPNQLPGIGWTFPGSPARQFVGDFDGDGRSDYLWEKYSWWVARSNGTGFEVSSAPWLPNQLPGIGWTFPADAHARQFVGDFDGDGRTDYLFENSGWWVARSTGTSFEVSTAPWLPNQLPGIGWTFPADVHARQFVGDFDGDGRSDYLFENGGWWVARSTGTSFEVSTAPWLPNQLPGIGWTFPADVHARQFVGDFDGDGRTDYLFENSGWWVARSNGNAFEVSSEAWLPNQVPGIGWTFPADAHSRQFVADFDGDGRSDYFFENGGWWVARSDGTAFETPKRWLENGANGAGTSYPDSSSSRQFVADFTGDGFADYLWEANGWHVASTLLEASVCESLDTDQDGVPNSTDNCPFTSNPTQNDEDGNGRGDACDHDCSDGLDNDGDGRVDYPADLGCTSHESPTEAPACSDGLDNDDDGAIDFDGGPGATDPDADCGGLESGTSEAVPEPGTALGTLLGSLVLAAFARRARS